MEFCKNNSRSFKNSANMAGELFCPCRSPNDNLKNSENVLQCLTHDLASEYID
jgi:hypothetical protein